MQRQCLLLVFYVYSLCASSVVVSGSNVTSLSCPAQKDEPRCNLCVTARNSSSMIVSEARKLMDSYLDYQQILVYEGQHEFRWYFNNATMLESRHMYITFYTWDDETMIGLPIPNCCRLPISLATCPVTQPLSGNIYYSLTLFRATVIRHHKYIHIPAQPSLPGILTTKPYLLLPPNEINSSEEDDQRNDRNNTEMTTHSTTNSSTSISKPDVQRFLSLPGRPGKHPSTFNPSPPAHWLNYTRHDVAGKFSDVCLFTLDQDVVLRNATTPPKFNLESHLFNRGVFSLPGYSYKNDIITNSMNGEEVECESRSFEGTSIFNFTSNNSDNDTFTCMVLWFSLNKLDELEVKCMPHNATYFQPTLTPVYRTGANLGHTYPPPPPVATAEMDVFLITIICSVAGGSLLICISIFIFCKGRRVNKLILSTKEVPETLKKVMSESPTNNFEFDEEIPEERFTCFDEIERQRIGKSHLYGQQNSLSNDYVLKLKHDLNLKLHYGGDQKRTFHGYVEKDIQRNTANHDQRPKVNFDRRAKYSAADDRTESSNGLSEDSGISSGISSGLSPLSESNLGMEDRDEETKTIHEDLHGPAVTKFDDSGLSSTHNDSCSESGSPKRVLPSTFHCVMKNENQYEKELSLAKNHSQDQDASIRRTDNLKKMPPFYYKDIVTAEPPVEKHHNASSTSLNIDNSITELQPATLQQGVYSKVHDFCKPNETLPTKVLPENSLNDINPTIADAFDQQELKSSITSPGFEEKGVTFYPIETSDSFYEIKHNKLDCNDNDLPTVNTNVTKGYSSKDAFVLSF